MIREGSSVSITATESPVTSPDEHSSIRSVESRESQNEINQLTKPAAENGKYYFQHSV